MSTELWRWRVFVAHVLRQSTKKKLYDTIKKAADVRKEVTAAAKVSGNTFSGATASELVDAVEEAGVVSERVRTFLYEAYPREVEVAPRQGPPKLREMRQGASAENAEEDASTVASPGKRSVGASDRKEGGGGGGGGGDEAEEKGELATADELSQKREREMDSVRRAGELHIWERWLVPGTQVQTHFEFKTAPEVDNVMWRHTQTLPSYNWYLTGSVELAATVLSCSDGKCVVELSNADYGHLARPLRRMTFSWSGRRRTGRWEPTHAIGLFGREPEADQSYIYAPHEMLMGLVRRFLKPSARGKTVMLYRPWTSENGSGSQYFPGTWARGEIRKSSTTQLVIRVDRQDVHFRLPARDRPETGILPLRATTTLLQPAAHRKNAPDVRVIYEMSLVPRLSEQLETIAESTTNLLPDILIRLIGDFIA